MQPLPHHYTVAASGSTTSDLTLDSAGLETMRSASPAQFDGPGDRWSPETLLVGAVAGCLILTFRAVARAAGLAWTSLECDVTGTLDRVERTTRFVAFEARARLLVPTGTSQERAMQALEKAERTCLVSKSINAPIHFVPTVAVAESAVAQSDEATAMR